MLRKSKLFILLGFLFLTTSLAFASEQNNHSESQEESVAQEGLVASESQTAVSPLRLPRLAQLIGSPNSVVGFFEQGENSQGVRSLRERRRRRMNDLRQGQVIRPVRIRAIFD